MKLRSHTLAAIVTSAVFASCAGDDNKDYTDKSVIPTEAEKAAAQKAAPNSTMPASTAMPANMQPQAIPGTAPVMVSSPQQITAGQQSNVVMTPVQTQVQPTAPGMNPPHGQPGHRCDIPVGAPLNSKPAAPAATTVNAQPQVTMTEVPTKVKTLPGMNPPHGEPGHRCDIAVGAPLNSKPATPTTVTTSSAPASIAPPPLLTAPKTDSSKN